MKNQTPNQIRPVLFLDFDDVICLNQDRGGYDAMLALGEIEKNPSVRLEDFAELWAVLFDEGACANLKAIHDEFEPTYVLSTSWCRLLDGGALRTILSCCGLGFVAQNLHVDFQTDQSVSQEARSKQISRWLTNHSDLQNQWVVLDDKYSGTGFHEWPSTIDRDCVVLCEKGIGISAQNLLGLRSAMSKRVEV